MLLDVCLTQTCVIDHSQAGSSRGPSNSNMPSTSVSTSSSSTNHTSCSRLFRSKYSIDTVTSTNSGSTSSTSSTPTGSTDAHGAPTLCLQPKLSGSATPLEGPDTPMGMSSKPPTYRPPSHSSCADLQSVKSSPLPQVAAAPQLLSTYTPAAATGSVPTADGACTLPGTRSSAGFEDVEPYAYDVGDFSDSAEDYDRIYSSNSSNHTPCAAPGPERSCSPLCSPGCTRTPHCSPTSPAHSGVSNHLRHSFAAFTQLPGLHCLPDVTCSCDNPLFADDEFDATC